MHCCTTGEWDTEWKLHWYLYNHNNGWESLLKLNWHLEINRITIVWETVTLRSELVKCHFSVCFVLDTWWYELVSPLTLNFSYCWRNNWVLLRQLRSLDDKMGTWFNSFFTDSVISQHHKHNSLQYLICQWCNDQLQTWSCERSLQGAGVPPEGNEWCPSMQRW